MSKDWNEPSDDQKPMKEIPTKHLMHVCKLGKGRECCRYLVAGPDGIVCAKGSVLAPALDRRVEEDRMIARGDNCPGLEA